MKNAYWILTGLLLFGLQNITVAQKEPGKITRKDFERLYKPADTAYGAIVLSDMGQTEFIGNSRRGISLTFERHSVIHILNNTGMGAASVYIPLYSIGDVEEVLTELRATTYNLLGEELETVQLDKKSIFKEKFDRNRFIIKFTMPGVKAGSIIEYSYKLRSDFISNMQPWKFQGKYPVLFSHYQAQIPNFYYYIFQISGRAPIEHTSSEFTEYYNVGFAFSDIAVLHKWTARNVSPFEEENFMFSNNKYISGIEFYLAQYRFPNRGVKDVMGTWVDVSKKLMEDRGFGADLNKENNWLKNASYGLTISRDGDTLQKIKDIYNYLQDNFLVRGNAGIWLSLSHEQGFKNKNGFTADVNLLLVAILKHEKIKAYPVILRLREDGPLDEIYPLINKCNYVICVVEVKGKQYFLDASHKGLAFGQLPINCYNGHARIIYDDVANAIDLLADSVVEQSVTTVFIESPNNNEWTGHVTSKLGKHESFLVRSGLYNNDSSYFKSIQASYDDDVQLKNKKINAADKRDIPVSIEYECTFRREGELIYFNPMLGRALKENYFKAIERNYPVEMPYCIDEVYILNFEVPPGYVVEELPTSARVSLAENQGFFEYIINVSESTIQFRSRIKLNKALYEPDSYKDLRIFFGYVVKKHAEPIVLKKKK